MMLRFCREKSATPIGSVWNSGCLLTPPHEGQSWRSKLGTWCGFKASGRLQKCIRPSIGQHRYVWLPGRSNLGKPARMTEQKQGGCLFCHGFVYGLGLAVLISIALVMVGVSLVLPHRQDPLTLSINQHKGQVANPAIVQQAGCCCAQLLVFTDKLMAI